MNICVFLSSSDAVAPEYAALAREVGAGIARRGHTLVFGGNRMGLMGVLADAAKDAGGRVIGIVPKRLSDLGWMYPRCDQLTVTHDLRDRKAAMDTAADAFVALPGGLGTLEEVLEVINLKTLGYHDRPIVFLNHAGFYDPVFATFDSFLAKRFTRPEILNLYDSVPSAGEMFALLDCRRRA